MQPMMLDAYISIEFHELRIVPAAGGSTNFEEHPEQQQEQTREPHLLRLLFWRWRIAHRTSYGLCTKVSEPLMKPLELWKPQHALGSCPV